jgi:hypothetical protein
VEAEPGVEPPVEAEPGVEPPSEASSEEVAEASRPSAAPPLGSAPSSSPPLSEPPASGVPDLSVLHVDQLLALIQVEAVLELLERGASDAPSWSRREELLAEWELATPLVEGLATIADEGEARRRAALVLLASTLPTGPLAPAIRLALGTERGQAFLDVHEADGTIWLNKERFEELARFLAEREAVSDRMRRTEAAEQAVVLAEIAEREGYRVEPIRRALRREIG